MGKRRSVCDGSARQMNLALEESILIPYQIVLLFLQIPEQKQAGATSGHKSPHFSIELLKTEFPMPRVIPRI